MIDDKQRLELAREAVHDWKEGKLSAFSAMVAMDIIFRNEPPSERTLEWARKVAHTLNLEQLAQQFIDGDNVE